MKTRSYRRRKNILHRHSRNPAREAGVAQWAATVGNELFDLSEEPSKVGIAREYVSLLLERSQDENAVAVDSTELKRAQDLAKWIAGALALPSQLPDQKGILGSDS